eukprot:CAMPEP_0202689248 /NCGR_PEP_ID=MMETSP1385-20130828/4555_1 /ASSEMBLY_ACC=CAM_ASM_000861 /TAXON_ID=933848 /ORGANISM="Elphidium margaritaceum" /LENGTH=430 /DNA_ID=CAMNT_0049344355 /DNA_START=75 /DNA_END=1367 /DNA_ORIENTATION=+
MAASFPPMMFSMEELVGVVKLIIAMESAVAQDDDQKNNMQQKPQQKHHREPPNIQRWIAKRSKRDILFLLASISGVKAKVYSLPIASRAAGAGAAAANGSTTTTTSKSNTAKASVCKERVCRVSMDGKHLSMGEDGVNLDKRLEISLGVDICYSNVRLMLKQLGLYQYFTSLLGTHESGSGGGDAGAGVVDSSRHTFPDQHPHQQQQAPPQPYSASTIHDDLISKARFNAHLHLGSHKDRLNPKHCITIHDPSTSRTLILQLSNCSDRTMWAKGLCHLKHLNPKARNFRWSVVAYLIGKYASTLNAHSKNNLNHSKGLKSVGKGLSSALKMSLTAANKTKPAKPANHHPLNTPCYFEPFAALIRHIGHQNGNGLHPRYPQRYKEMFKRRQNRLRNEESNDKFGENELNFDPNKAALQPADNDVYYEGNLE